MVADIDNQPVDVCDTAKVRFFKQITTFIPAAHVYCSMFVILQKYDFSSKSQPQLWHLYDQFRCLWYCKSTIFQANHNNHNGFAILEIDVCDTAKVRFFKQITTSLPNLRLLLLMFVILQKYDFSSKSQLLCSFSPLIERCLWYCKSTIFQANHNHYHGVLFFDNDVCDTAKVRFFKQITTCACAPALAPVMFVILQKYDFSSKSQPSPRSSIYAADVCDTAKVRFFKQITTSRRLTTATRWCLWYCKSTIFQANHNSSDIYEKIISMFVILQKYDFSSKSQLMLSLLLRLLRCLWYCKSTIFQANHNEQAGYNPYLYDVCDTAKVRFFKQITTTLSF